MKRINITLDEETANLLDGKLNKSETIRQALLIHNGDVSTDTITGLRLSYDVLRKELKQQTELLQQLYELIEKRDSKPWFD